MGQTLSQPVTLKQTIRAGDKHFKVGWSSMQGWRVSMEDAHAVILRNPYDEYAPFFGVFDGHGGASVAAQASHKLFHDICGQRIYKEGHITEAIKQGFLKCDEDMKKNPIVRADLAGSTAIVVLIKDNKKLYCGNAGDSRAIAKVGDRVIALSKDHKPMDEDEYLRIVQAGGYVDMNRVNGNLALSRALGDFNFKANSQLPPERQIVTADPDVTVFDITPEWEFVVMACDGIWDVLTNEEVGRFVAERLAKNIQPHTIAEQLMDRCLAPDGQMGGIGLDNMTVIIIEFRKNKGSGTTDGNSATYTEDGEEISSSDAENEKDGDDGYGPRAEEVNQWTTGLEHVD